MNTVVSVGGWGDRSVLVAAGRDQSPGIALQTIINCRTYVCQAATRTCVAANIDTGADQISAETVTTIPFCTSSSVSSRS